MIYHGLMCITYHVHMMCTKKEEIDEDTLLVSYFFVHKMCSLLCWINLLTFILLLVLNSHRNSYSMIQSWQISSTASRMPPTKRYMQQQRRQMLMLSSPPFLRVTTPNLVRHLWPSQVVRNKELQLLVQSSKNQGVSIVSLWYL